METMQQKLQQLLGRGKDTFGSFTSGQKTVAIVGGAALLLAAFLVFRWASAPSYAPLYSNLSGEDASAVIDELDATGVKYEIADGGTSIMVPKDDVYAQRVALAGKGLPASSDGALGYGSMKDQGLTTSDAQQAINFKIAMEGELKKTIEAYDGVNTAVVHLAIPEKRVFSDEQDPTTASVLIDPAAGSSVDDEEVKAIVNLVASSIAGLEPKNVTVTDSSGTVLSSPDTATGAGAVSARLKEINAFQGQIKSQVQAALLQLVGPNNAVTTVTADLDFDKTTTTSRRFEKSKTNPGAISETTSDETYTGNDAAGPAAGGVVGPDGQAETNTTTSGGGIYKKSDATRDNPVDQTDTTSEKAPGEVDSLHIGVMLDATAAAAIQPAALKDQISAAIGINPDRGDTIDVQAMPFDKSAQDAAAKELADAAAADAKAKKNAMLRNIGIGGAIAVMLMLAWVQARRRAKARAEATDYIVEQLRADAASRAPAIESPAMAALETAEAEEEDTLRDDLLALVDRQPEDVAALLRGWLVEPR